MPYHDTPNIIQKSFTFFSIWYIVWSWSYPTPIEFCTHLLMTKIKYSILSELFIFCYLLTSAIFPSIFCFSSSITVFNSFLFTLYLSFNSLNLHVFFVCLFFFNSNYPLDSLSRKLTSWVSLFVCPSILCFHPGPFFSYALLSSNLSILSPTHLQP